MIDLQPTDEAVESCTYLRGRVLPLAESMVEGGGRGPLTGLVVDAGPGLGLGGGGATGGPWRGGTRGVTLELEEGIAGRPRVSTGR